MLRIQIRISRQTDYALYITLFCRSREDSKEYNDVTTLNRFDVIDKLVDEESIVIFNARQHARAHDAHRLVQIERNDENGNACRK